MERIVLKDDQVEFISSDLFKAVNEFSEILREKLGDDSERIFREILSDIFDYCLNDCGTYTETNLYGLVENPFF